jgi:lipoate-protein ligase B
VPCGIPDRRPASLEHLLGHQVGVAEASRELVTEFEGVFGCAVRRASRGELEELLRAHERALVSEHV